MFAETSKKGHCESKQYKIILHHGILYILRLQGTGDISGRLDWVSACYNWPTGLFDQTPRCQGVNHVRVFLRHLIKSMSMTNTKNIIPTSRHV